MRINHFIILILSLIQLSCNSNKKNTFLSNANFGIIIPCSGCNDCIKSTREFLPEIETQIKNGTIDILILECFDNKSLKNTLLNDYPEVFIANNEVYKKLNIDRSIYPRFIIKKENDIVLYEINSSTKEQIFEDVRQSLANFIEY